LHRLGKRGLWQGGAAKNLHLQNPVKLGPFQNLLAGRTPDGTQTLAPDASEPNRVWGWRLNIRAPESLNVQWALAPRRGRIQLERMHADSVTSALWTFERKVSGWRGGNTASREQYPAGLFAKFRSGATWDQIPRLQTTVFLFNLVFCRDGTIQTFSQEQVQKFRILLLSDCRLLELIMTKAQAAAFAKVTGANLCLYVPTARRLFTRQKYPNPIPGKQLFARWQQEVYAWRGRTAGIFNIVHQARGERRRIEFREQLRAKIQRTCQPLRTATDALQRLILRHERRSDLPQPKHSKDEHMTHSY